jgi:N-acetylmuramoyl-L-alanine amidase
LKTNWFWSIALGVGSIFITLPVMAHPHIEVDTESAEQPIAEMENRQSVPLELPSANSVDRTVIDNSQRIGQAAPAVIEAIELSEDGTQLIIRSDRSVGGVDSGWRQRITSHYIELRNAQLAPQVMLPDLTDHPGLLSVQVEQTDPTTVTVQLELAARVQVGTVVQPDVQRLIVPLRGLTTALAMTPELITQRIEGIILPNVADVRPLIVIDPGHGGIDPGAVGINGLQEIQVIFPISLRVTELLQQHGANVVLTRQDNRTLDLEPRVQLAERVNADMFVSIHANAISMTRPDVNGVETYYYYSSGREVAEFIQDSLLQATGMRDRGVKSARFYVLVNTSMPSTLVEVGFVTGAEDAPLLSDPLFRELLAHAIARGILEYVQAQ